MRAIRFSDRRFLNAVAALGLLVGMALPAFIPSFASASEITTRSIDMSSSAISATSVSYTVTFTPVATTAAGYIIDFCDNTPLVGNACTAPGGMSTTGVGTSTGGATVTAASGAGVEGAKVVDTLTGGTPSTVVLTGITNPNYQTTGAADNGFYARIVTYDNSTDLGAANTAGNGNTGVSGVLPTGNEDSGAMALSTTSAFSVSGAVLESMTFCVAGTNTDVSGDDNCTNGSVTSVSPNLNLGTDDGGTYVLSNNEGSPSTGTVYTQLSTNAVGGAVVNLKSSTTGCGGLENVEDSSDCIPPLTTSGFTTGSAGFGAETGLASAVATTGDSSALGAIDPATNYNYNTSYYMDYDGGAGITSTYGAPILNSNSAPVNDMNMPLIFAAASNSNTPAGEYSATLNLIATGTF